jgi:hypothetical protein
VTIARILKQKNLPPLDFFINNFSKEEIAIFDFLNFRAKIGTFSKNRVRYLKERKILPRIG